MSHESKYFSRGEFACQYTGENEIKDELIKKLDLLRAACGFPFIITSGYRSPTHPIEAKKEKAGTHAQGIAADIKVSGGNQRYTIVSVLYYCLILLKKTWTKKPFLKLVMTGAPIL